MKTEPVIAMPGFALGTGQRIFLMGFGVQEHREVFTDRGKPCGQHFFGRAPDDNIIPITRRQAEQSVAYGATDNVGLHGRRLVF